MPYFKSGYSGYIWNYLKQKIGNEYGVAGLMGNLYAESHLYPDIVEGDTARTGKSEKYTAAVDSGQIGEEEFVNYGYNGSTNRRGYGLAQWTYRPRKRALYNMWKSGGYPSIGSIELALDYLWHELTTDYKGVLTVLQNATSIAQASDKVLVDFENPAEYHYTTRQGYSKKYYDAYAGTSGDVTPPVNPDDPDAPITPTKGKNLSKLLLFAIGSDLT